MPRVHRVKKARKDNPVVKAGEPYFWWKRAWGRKQYSTTYPKPSQLVSSGKLAQFAEANESVEDAWDNTGDREDVINLVDILEEAMEQVREVGEEYREGADNQREYFPDSEQADESEEKADACESVANSIEIAQGEIQDWLDDEDKSDEDLSDDVEAAVEGIDWSEFGWV